MEHCVLISYTIHSQPETRPARATLSLPCQRVQQRSGRKADGRRPHGGRFYVCEVKKARAEHDTTRARRPTNAKRWIARGHAAPAQNLEGRAAWGARPKIKALCIGPCVRPAAEAAHHIGRVDVVASNSRSNSRATLPLSCALTFISPARRRARQSSRILERQRTVTSASPTRPVRPWPHVVRQHRPLCRRHACIVHYICADSERRQRPRRLRDRLRDRAQRRARLVLHFVSRLLVYKRPVPRDFVVPGRSRDGIELS